MTPTHTHDDPAAALAKEAITRFCEAAKDFLRTRAPGITMDGFRLPFAPLAAKIRECAAALNATPTQAPTPVQRPAVQEAVTPKPEPPAVVTMTPNAATLLAFLAGKSKRVGDIADKFGVSKETIIAVIQSPGSGLSFSGKAGWVTAATE